MNIDARSSFDGKSATRWVGLGRSVVVAALLSVIPAIASAQPPALNDLIAKLKAGGYVLVMRHASASPEAPSKETARPDNPTLERQLDERGRKGAIGMGEAIRRLRIPTGDVLSSPAYRALETVKLAGLVPIAVPELGGPGANMQQVSEAQASWLKAKAAEVPKRGNALIVTHVPNLARAFPTWGPTLQDGDTVVLHPDGRGGVRFEGRVKIDDWPAAR